MTLLILFIYQLSQVFVSAFQLSDSSYQIIFKRKGSSSQQPEGTSADTTTV